MRRVEWVGLTIVLLLLLLLLLLTCRGGQLMLINFAISVHVCTKNQKCGFYTIPGGISVRKAIGKMELSKPQDIKSESKGPILKR